MADKTYKVTATKGESAVVTVQARNHSIVIDEPAGQGGTDMGMNPVELLLSSIASCLALTLSIYSEAMGVKAQNIEIGVEGLIDSAGMKGSRKASPGLKKIQVTVNAQSNVEPETFQQVVDLVLLRCPVEDSVAHGVAFEEPIVNIRQI
ncbi:MAG: OsmC family protein [Clostridiales bacterium]|nr:OsmC family protein [Clostridiales bacterium]